MALKTLTPVPLKDSYWLDVKKSIDRILYNLIYKKLKYGLRLDIELKNQRQSPVAAAILRGDIYYSNGSFKGKFSSSVSKAIVGMGGKFNKIRKSWGVPYKELDANILSALTVRDLRDEELNQKAISILDAIDTNDIDPNMFEREISGILGDFDRRLDRTFKKAQKEKSIPTVSFKLTQDQKQIISDEWANDLTLYIKEFADEQILDLRGEVLKNTTQGLRAENLEDMIVASYGVSQRKAKFLARQETSLLVSKYRETKYTSLGLNRYVWMTSKDERVRDSHKKLNGKVYFFGEPPVVNMKGDRKPPGEDYGCRCVAKAIVD